MKSVPLYTDQRGKLNMAIMFIQAGREELAMTALQQIADTAQKWVDHNGGKE